MNGLSIVVEHAFEPISVEETLAFVGRFADEPALVVLSGDVARSSDERGVDRGSDAPGFDVMDFAGRALPEISTALINLPWFSTRGLGARAVARVIVHEILHLIACRTGEDSERLWPDEARWEETVETFWPTIEARCDGMDVDEIASLLHTAARVYDEYRVESSVIEAGHGPTLRDVDEECRAHRDELLAGDGHAMRFVSQRVAHALAARHAAPTSPLARELHLALAPILAPLAPVERPSSDEEALETVAAVLVALLDWRDALSSTVG